MTEPEDHHDGPITVYTSDKDTHSFDRVNFVPGALMGWTIEAKAGGSTTRYGKGTKAQAIPMHMVEHVEWENYG